MHSRSKFLRANHSMEMVNTRQRPGSKLIAYIFPKWSQK
ncbi:hypothetical protein ABI_17530 [Asticcacaulis biprosthecium C19]|uniref:Uncharacterized protein n=1 Tax=Asticcacaulis biprosthecium C19 TaxID=715226 RepID=F4QKD5_9CAUL|nr:hypothetical protein ABI_17530 [Asticcacaulis biprosthecium C19]